MSETHSHAAPRLRCWGSGSWARRWPATWSMPGCRQQSGTGRPRQQRRCLRPVPWWPRRRGGDKPRADGDHDAADRGCRGRGYLRQGKPQGFSQGAVWAQMGTIGVAATTRSPAGMASSGPMSCSSTRRYPAARLPPRRASCSSWLPARPRRSRSSSPFAAIGRKTVWLGEAGQGSRMKLVVNAYMSYPDRGRGRGPRAGQSAGHRPRRAWPRLSRAARLTLRLPTPSCTRSRAATSRPSSRSSGH